MLYWTVFLSIHHTQHTASACSYTHTKFWMTLTINGIEKLWQKYSNGIWECSQAIRDKKGPRDTKCCFGLLYKCSQSHLYCGIHIWNIIIESAYTLPSDSKKYMCEVYKLSIYYSLNRYYVHAIYETLKKQKLIICVPLPQNILISMGYIEKYTDICNADLIQSWRIIFFKSIYI